MGDLRDDELEHLSMILTKIGTEVDALEESLEDKQKEIIKLKRDYWDSLNEIHEMGYEAKTNRQNIEDTVNTADERLQQLHLYQKMQDSPYFGRIDFIYDGEVEAETYYIGIGSFYPKWATRPLIFDWRAPVSSLFYDYDKGKASFIAPAGNMEGEIVRKVQYKIIGGKLEYFFENDMKIDDDILKNELGLHANATLKSIVATIQKEQNEIIRNEKDRILVVQGAAGSGKTSIALHRIAYLLYHKRKEFTAKDILILSPNSVFSDYISHILPELGEENIVEMSFDDFAEKELKGITKFESRYANLESFLAMQEGTMKRDKRVKREKRKQSKEFVHALDRYALKMDQWIVQFRDINFKNIYRSADSLRILFQKKFTKIPLLKRLEVVAEFVIEEEATLRGEELDIIVAETIKGKIMDMYVTADLLRIYNRFLNFRGESGIAVDNRCVYYEDVYPLLYLKYLLYGRLEYRQIKHLVVDEMQDYSYMQYILVKQLFPCPMTILGDKEQVASDEASTVLEQLPEIFGENIRIITLNKSYRSTYEIGTFAGSLIHQTDTEYVKRYGRAPVIEKNHSNEEMMQKLSSNLKNQEGWETIAIICKTGKEVKDIYEELNDQFVVTCITEETDQFQKGIVIVPFYLAKGLEFDVVHIPFVSSDSYASALQRQILYISCTRALHELYLYEEK
jgi:DNA helicase-2/ATP-dependent DNA helicase PcrA